MKSETFSPASPHSATPRPAATVLIVRDPAPAARGLEVLMVRRSATHAFGASAWVFPGGSVCEADRNDRWASFSEGDFDPFERAVRIAAVRETFEESGLLLARRPGSPAALEPGAMAVLAQQRERVEADPHCFLELVADAGLCLDLERLAPFAHWITPSFEPKRYDTRFFLIAAPEAQAARHDGREADDHAWLTPQDALDMRARGEAKLMFPTRLNLEMLGASPNVEAAERAARSRPMVTVEPRIVEQAGRRMLSIPAEAGYSVAEEDLDSVGG